MPDLLYMHTACIGPSTMTITFLGTPTGGTERLPLYSFHVPAGFRYIMEGDELLVWGVVRYSVRDHAQ
ncbi:hypothetical protein AL532_22310 [Pseudomonas monteilii]|nr:hypothetical protein AL532_22310 [Pseudomonas monteilii]